MALRAIGWDQAAVSPMQRLRRGTRAVLRGEAGFERPIEMRGVAARPAFDLDEQLDLHSEARATAINAIVRGVAAQHRAPRWLIANSYVDFGSRTCRNQQVRNGPNVLVWS